MAEEKMNRPKARRSFRYRGRLTQIPIYLGKFLRGFIYLNDWKVLPMAAIIAALVAMVVHGGYFLSMEGTLEGSLALCCVAIWNGCFNSIQVICRERQIIKREHRSGMHISSYIIAHMLYQALLCLAQTGITLYICAVVGVQFPKGGFISSNFFLDFGFTLFLISYASDMLSLLISSLAHSTTAAMTVMPFILIFQLVFSGGIFPLPGVAEKISDFSISRYGISCLAAQAGYNELPTITGWNSLARMRSMELGGTMTLREALAILQNTKNGAIVNLRAIEVAEGLSLGDVIDMAADTELVRENLDHQIEYRTTLGDVMQLIGEETIRDKIFEVATAASQNASYEKTRENILFCWQRLALLTVSYVCLAILLLEFIDKDKR